ncbi:MAG: protein translocase subunit SecF [Cellvibrio sp.]|uniref:protein translocase subunit SecF n=1 Tax=Cellvibrio sp. TaxID=1965322 RepID=UPI0031B34020
MAYELKVIDFMGIRKYTNAFSIVVAILAIASIVFQGFKFGLDFTGGTQLEVQFDQPADLAKVRHVLEEEKLHAPVAVTFGSDRDVMIRTQDQMSVKGRELITAEIAKLGNGAALFEVARPTREQDGFVDVIVISNVTPEQITQANIFDAERFGRTIIGQRDAYTTVAVEKGLELVYSQALLKKLQTETGASIKLRSSESVGPQIGDELRDSGGLGILFAFGLVFLYVAVQFQWKFSVGALVGLVHVTLVTLACFTFFQWDFDLVVLAAIIALIGYSINDTIVIFDRIRENFRKLRAMDPIEIVNISMTQTLGRSLMTHVTVFLVMAVLYIFGGELLSGFSKAMMIGVVFGCFSSIYIAANVTVAMGISKEDLMPRPKEGEEGADLSP